MLRIKIRPTAHPIVRLLVTGKSTDIRHFVKTTGFENDIYCDKPLLSKTSVKSAAPSNGLPVRGP